jgi:hypothetical protein
MSPQTRKTKIVSCPLNFEEPVKDYAERTKTPYEHGKDDH